MAAVRASVVPAFFRAVYELCVVVVRRLVLARYACWLSVDGADGVRVNLAF